MESTTWFEGRRWGLDRLVRMLAEPCFALRFRRRTPMAEVPGHVSPTALALESPRSRYVRRWRKHARTCPRCAEVFRHFGFSTK